jgi:predicted nucleic acid-binding protein
LSAVVLYELTVGAKDDKDVRNFESKLRKFEKDNKLIIPNGEDWFLAGKVLNSLQRGRKAANKSKTPKISAEESRRIMREVLIARTARRENALLVTDNVSDFEKIRGYCKVRIVTGKEFFGITGSIPAASTISFLLLSIFL